CEERAESGVDVESEASGESRFDVAAKARGSDDAIRKRRKEIGLRRFAVRPEGADYQWRKIASGELSIDLVADERLGRVTDWAGAW
ncbi:MAG: hypothetical protein ACRECN_00475, partial [Methylocella sp.]